VRQAVVRREWPDRLAVRLEEYQPVALWGAGDDSATRLVSRQGEVFDANVGDVEDDHLPTLQGPDGSAPQVLAMLHRLAPVLARLDAGIDVLALSERGSWRVGRDSGAGIELGRGPQDEGGARPPRLVGTLTQVTSRYKRALLSADLRHNDGYALRLKGITTTPMPAAASAGRSGTR
jgi:cell division protein FtsQ